MRKRRKLLIRIFILIIILSVWYFNTFTLKTTSVYIKNEKINDEITIVQITDLHGASFGKNNSALISRINKVNPDFVVAAGDMYSSGSETGRETAVSLLCELAASHTVYFVNGEHDNDESYMSELEENGVRVLDYRYEDLIIGSTSLRLYGITNAYYSPTFDLANEFELDSSKYNILLAHIDNFEAFADFGIDLSLCGDTHGGQVNLPFIGAVQNNGVWFPELSGDEEDKRVKGLFENGRCVMFVSSGLGNYPVPVRLFNRPEIAVIHLEPEI